LILIQVARYKNDEVSYDEYSSPKCSPLV